MASKSGKLIDRRTRWEIEARGKLKYEGEDSYLEYCAQRGLDPDRVRRRPGERQ